MVTLSLKKGQAGWESSSLRKDESPTNKFILCLDFSDQLTNVENFQLQYITNPIFRTGPMPGGGSRRNSFTRGNSFTLGEIVLRLCFGKNFKFGTFKN